jgi:hypothetical protein
MDCHPKQVDESYVCDPRVSPWCNRRNAPYRSPFAHRIIWLVLTLWVTATSLRAAGPGTIEQDPVRKLITLTEGDGKLTLRLNYANRCIADRIVVRGRQVAADSGVSSGVKINGQWFTTGGGIATPNVKVAKDTVTVTGIVFGPPDDEVHENWKFKIQADRIVWWITRTYTRAAALEDVAFPEWDFGSLATWTGGLLDDGGVVWNKYLDTPNATYGAHAGTVTFWNHEQGDGLRIIPTLPKGQYGAVRFSHQPNSQFSFNYSVSGENLKPNHDQCRYLPDRQDLWAPFPAKPGTVTIQFDVRAIDYNEAYNRGTFHGVDGRNIGELLNTVARYGVIDRHLVGGNGWRSGYICLHEQWFGEVGLALDEPDYIANFSDALEYERKHAIGPDGRVKARWTYNAGDAMPGTYDALGFYEAQWGYLLDSQPDFVINVAEQFDLTGDLPWLDRQKIACEKTLDFLLDREVPHSGLVAMMTDSGKEQRGSDWIDIIWASYENALVNAELYEALTLWSGAEDNLGDPVQAARYRDFAARLKTSFNRPIADGGFWDPVNEWYVHWRDKDGSIHGNNLVTPVNFAAIGYGLCDDPARQKAILDRMEAEMQKEQLFSWPLCFFPYQPEEGAGSNFPFPKYENGDLFLSWGELGVRAYAAYDPALALKYVKKVLARYAEDGLSFQRYLRASQQGAGDDILAGNCMAIVGLYRDIYGIQPQPNRLYLEPRLTGDLNGTELSYQLRDVDYRIHLSVGAYAVTFRNCTLQQSQPFGVNPTRTGLEYFPGKNPDWAMSISQPAALPFAVQIESWPDDPNGPRKWTEVTQETNEKTQHVITQLRAHARYILKATGQAGVTLVTGEAGQVHFTTKVDHAGPQKFELDLATP